MKRRAALAIAIVVAMADLKVRTTTVVVQAFRPAVAPVVVQAFRPAVGADAPYVIVDLRTDRIVSWWRRGSLDAPIVPGSVMKIAALVAALESGAITASTALLCKRDASIDKRRLPCSHPDLHRPLTPAEALAHSCNDYFTTVAARLSRGAFDRALAVLGLPRAAPNVALPLEALGIDGIKATPRALIQAVARLAREPSELMLKRATLETVREGLQGASRYGTASALQAGDVDALAKTGTAASGGAFQGLVVAVAPARDPALGIALVAPGASGADAAALAAPLVRDALARRQPAVAGRQVARDPVVRVGFARESSYAVAAIPLEAYVARVLAGEAARGSAPAALQALAITIRTFALANLGRHRADGFDLCDLTHCQVVRAATPATEEAARATAGSVLLYRGVPAQVFYTASCGGRTERPSAVWPGAEDLPFLVSRADPAADRTPWSSELTAESLERALAAAGFRGRLRGLRVASRTGSGRVATLRLAGFSPDEISGQGLRAALGRTLGWQHVKSTAFDLDRTSTGYRFAGHGSGHGVGLCVIGSAAIAAKGRTADEILATYFPGLTRGGVPVTAPATDSPGSSSGRPPATAAATEVVVSLPSGDEGERDSIVALAARARDDLVRRLSVSRPARLVLRFHPTVESYQRATGQEWYTAGATAREELHFVPLTVLRERGVLERTIRHEIVHRLTADALASRRLWVREGVAVYFAGERSVPGGVSRARPLDVRRLSCPQDEELNRPASPGALSNAYARAGACFERQIAAGKKWTDVK